MLNVTGLPTNVTHDLANATRELSEWQLLVLRYNLRLLPPGGYMACAIYLLTVGLVATAGNTTTLIMFTKSQKLRSKPHNMLLINLAVSDLGISVFGYPLTMLSCFSERWLFGLAGCTVQGFTTFVFALADMYTLTILSVYRWVAVCLPHHNHKLGVGFTRKVLVALWAVCLIICSLPLLGMSSYTPEPFGTSCTIDWDDPKPASAFYVYMLILVAYLLPVSVMFYCYYKVVIRSGEILKTLKQSSAKTLNIGEAEAANMNLAESKVTWVSLSMVGVFLILWTPYSLLSLVAIHDADIPLWVTTLPTMFCKASCMLNPVIFYLTNPTFRKTFKETFFRARKVAPLAYNRTTRTFKVDRTRDGVFIGESNVTFRNTETTMF